MAAKVRIAIPVLRSVVSALIMASAIGLMIERPAAARDWPDVEGWSVVQGDGADCGILQTYEGAGETKLIVGLKGDGSYFIVLTNANWSSKEGDEYDVSWVLDDDAYRGKAFGTTNGGRPGFLSTFGPFLGNKLEKAGRLSVYRGDQLIDQLSLKGSASALAVARRCLAVAAAEETAARREKERLAHIPVDPFATPAASGTSTKGILASLVSKDDYPPSSARAGEEGDVRVKVQFGDSGRAESCVILASSGSSTLDRATCQAITRRSRMPKGQVVEETITWRLPKP